MTGPLNNKHGSSERVLAHVFFSFACLIIPFNSDPNFLSLIAVKAGIHLKLKNSSNQTML